MHGKKSVCSADIAAVVATKKLLFRNSAWDVPKNYDSKHAVLLNAFVVRVSNAFENYRKRNEKDRTADQTANVAVNDFGMSAIQIGDRVRTPTVNYHLILVLFRMENILYWFQRYRQTGWNGGKLQFIY